MLPIPSFRQTAGQEPDGEQLHERVGTMANFINGQSSHFTGFLTHLYLERLLHPDPDSHIKELDLRPMDVASLDSFYTIMRKYPELERLFLPEKWITDDVIQEFAWRGAHKYFELYGGSQLTDEGLRYIGKWKNLCEVDLSQATKMTNRGLYYLRGMKNLKKLWVPNTDAITDADLASLFINPELEIIQRGESETPIPRPDKAVILEAAKRVKKEYDDANKREWLKPVTPPKRSIHPIHRSKPKYELTDNICRVDGHILHQVLYPESSSCDSRVAWYRIGNILHQIVFPKFPSEKEGPILGGYIESEKNLSQEGRCVVHCGAYVYGDAQIRDNAEICSGARIFGNAIVDGCSRVAGYRRHNSKAVASKEVWSPTYVPEYFENGEFRRSTRLAKDPVLLANGDLSLIDENNEDCFEYDSDTVIAGDAHVTDVGIQLGAKIFSNKDFLRVSWIPPVAFLPHLWSRSLANLRVESFTFYRNFRGDVLCGFPPVVPNLEKWQAYCEDKEEMEKWKVRLNALLEHFGSFHSEE